MEITVTLNNGVAMPALGLGVFLAPPEETGEAVRVALETGYRLIDTAAAYFNERAVGQGIRDSGVDRGEIFVTTKLWVTQYGSESAMTGFEASLERLGLEYLDLYLLHWPLPSDFEATVAAYRTAERLLAEQRVRAVGVCNFMPHHLERLRAATEVPPAVNQIELNPFFQQRSAQRANAMSATLTQSWAPIGGSYLRHPEVAPAGTPTPLEHPLIRELAAKYGKTPAQVVIRWHLEHGFSVIPKSVHAERIVENFDVFDFSLAAAEVAAIDALETGRRGGGDPDHFTAESYPIDVEAQ